MRYREVAHEPIAKVCDGDENSPALIADLGVRGVPQGEALFDVRVADTDATSYVNRPVSAVLGASIYLLLNCTMPLLPLLLSHLMGHLVMKL